MTNLSYQNSLRAAEILASTIIETLPRYEGVVQGGNTSNAYRQFLLDLDRHYIDVCGKEGIASIDLSAVDIFELIQEARKVTYDRILSSLNPHFRLS